MNTENSICAFCGWEKKDHRYGYCYHYSSESEDHFYTDKKFIATENSSHGYSEGSEVPESNKEGEDKSIINFLLGSDSYDGYWWQETPRDKRPTYWWRTKLREELQSLRDQLAAKDREISNLKEALKAIANPIKHMQESLKDDEQLNGPYAITLANDPHYYRNIAEKALLTYNKIK